MLDLSTTLHVKIDGVEKELLFVDSTLKTIDDFVYVIGSHNEELAGCKKSNLEYFYYEYTLKERIEE